MAGLISMQLMITETFTSGRVGPDNPALWRATFTVAALAAVIGLLMLGHSLLRAEKYTTVVRRMHWVAAPLYLLVAVVAAFESVRDELNLQLSSMAVEGILRTLLVLFGVHLVWVLLTAPRGEDDA